MGVAAIEKKLQDLTNEVDEFHPILRALFPKLPDIINCEYHHGANEMGADFVLYRQDRTLKQTDYIGVIAKIGAVKQSNASIDRQIEECELERLIQNGKKKVFLSEIWIVVSGNISSNFKEKINHKYKFQKINFLDVNLLSNLIHEHMPDFLSKIPTEFMEYLNYLRSENNSLEQRNNLLPVDTSSFYIDQQLRKLKQTSIRLEANEKKSKNLTFRLL